MMPRSDVSAVVLNDRALFCGGELYSYGFEVLGDTWAAEARTFRQWESVALSSPWPARAYHAGDVVTTRWIFTGGGRCIANFSAAGAWCGRQYLWFGDVWATEDGAHWSLLASSGNSTGVYAAGDLTTARGGGGGDGGSGTSAGAGAGASPCSAPSVLVANETLFCPRGGHSLTTVGSALVLVGGVTNDAQLNDVWRSDDGGVTWRCVAAPAPFPPRSFHDTAALPASGGGGGPWQLVVAGGGTFDTQLNDVWASSDIGASWQLVAPAAPWVPRYAHTLSAVGGVLVLTGGLTNPVNASGTADVWTSADGGATWAEATPAAPWPPRSFHSVVVVPGTQRLLLIGGWILRVGAQYPFGYEYVYYNDVWESECST